MGSHSRQALPFRTKPVSGTAFRAPPSPIGNAQKSLSQQRDRWFESGSLQRRVRLSLDFSFLYRKAGSCRGVRGPGQAARPAETRGAREHHANCR
jgi:hypothetical protein